MKRTWLSAFLILLAGLIGSGCATRTSPEIAFRDAGIGDFSGAYENVGTSISHPTTDTSPTLWFLLTRARARAQQLPDPEGQAIVTLSPAGEDRLVVRLRDRDGETAESETLPVSIVDGSLRLKGTWWCPAIGVSHRLITVHITRDGDCVVADDMRAGSFASGYTHHQHTVYRRRTPID